MHISCSVIKLWSLTFKSEIEEKACCFSNLSSKSDVAKTLTFPRQCKTVRQRTNRYPFVHYSALFLCTFSVFHSGNFSFFFPCCTFFMLYSFHVPLFHTAPFPCSNFCIVIFSCYTFFCCTLFMYGSISGCTFTHCNVFATHSFRRVALFACCNFSCCTFLMLDYFQKCSHYPHKNLRWRALQQ